MMDEHGSLKQKLLNWTFAAVGAVGTWVTKETVESREIHREQSTVQQAVERILSDHEARTRSLEANMQLQTAVQRDTARVLEELKELEEDRAKKRRP